MSETGRSIRNCNVCVVGGAGFLGSHLVNHLIDDRKCNVVVIDNLVTGLKKHIHEKATFEHGDITGPESGLLNSFRRHEIEYVFNYAAEPYIPVSFERPLHVFNTNAFGALKVINAAQEAGCEGILQVSSAEIYGDQDGKISESAQVSPHSTYGASKAAIDFTVQARWKEARTPCIALRQFNCLGERETHPYIVPEIISQIHHEEYGEEDGIVNVKLGNNSCRDFLYAGDAVKMAVELLEMGDFGQVYNLGSESTIKMYDLAEKIGKLMGEGAKVLIDLERVRPWEIWHLQSDNSKIYDTIDYRPTVSLDEGLERTIKSYDDIHHIWSWE